MIVNLYFPHLDRGVDLRRLSGRHDRRAYGEQLDHMAAPAVALLRQRNSCDALGAEFLCFGLHALHRRLAGVHFALVRANEKAAEPRRLAGELNDIWISVRKSQLLELQAKYERADAEAESAKELERIVGAEQD